MDFSSLLLIFGVITLAAILYIMFKDKLSAVESKTKSGNANSALELLIPQGSSSDKLIEDYDVYSMTAREKIVNVLLAAVFITAIGMVFYRNLNISLMFTPLALFYPKIKLKSIIKNRKLKLLMQFREALYIISSSLSAGSSVENSFIYATKELQSLFLKQDTLIITEFKYIANKLAMNQSIEEVMTEFASRSKIEDIVNFADVFVVSKRTGGNLVEAIKNAIKVINEKIEFKQELNTMLAQKKFEQKMLNVIPIALILMLTSMSADYMRPVFTTFVGRIVMTLAAGILVASYFVSKKIVDIEI